MTCAGYRDIVLLVLLASGTVLSILVFFFQAEDGIRDRTVTGVQTCALPIYDLASGRISHSDAVASARGAPAKNPSCRDEFCRRSEERRVGKECRSRWLEEH